MLNTRQTNLIILTLILMATSNAFILTSPHSSSWMKPDTSFELTDQIKIYKGGSVEAIEVVAYADLEDALAALESGDADIFGHRISETEYDTIDSYPNVKKQWAHDTISWWLAINFEAYPLTSVHLRRAMAYAIDKTAVTQIATNGTAVPADFLVNLNSEFSLERTEGGVFYDSDLELAQYELGLAGMLDVSDDGFVEAPDGSTLTLNLTYPQDFKGMSEVATMISSSLNASGLRCVLVPSNFTALQSGLENHTISYSLALYQATYDAYDASWGITTFSSQHVDVLGQNIANVQDDEIDDAIYLYNDAFYLDRAGDILRSSHRKVAERCPVVPLFNHRWLSVYSDANFNGWLNETNGGAFSVWTPVSVTPKGLSTTLRVAVLPSFFTEFFVSLNPFSSGQLISRDWIVTEQFNPYMLIYDSPMAISPDGRAVPRHATYWTTLYRGIVSDLKITQSRAEFYCDPFANWTDGAPVTSEDYRFTFEYYAEHSLVMDSNLIDSVKVTGIHRAGVTLDELGMFRHRQFGSMPILPRHIWSNKNDTNWQPAIEEAIGSGPFIASVFDPNVSLVLELNPNYYPELDTEPPVLISIDLIPEDPIPAETVSVRAIIQDRSKISNVTLSWTHMIQDFNFTGSSPMVESALGYVATISPKVAATKTEFKIHAVDVWGNSGHVYTGIYAVPDSTDMDSMTSNIIIATVGIASILGTIVWMKRR